MASNRKIRGAVPRTGTRGRQEAEETPHENRDSREQEARASEPVHENYNDSWEPQGLLDTANVPPRPGYVQRWVSTLLDDKPDMTNLARRMNEGWKPRKADTVNSESFVQKVHMDQFGDVVGIHGMILMERPVEVHKRQERYNAQAAKDMGRAARESEFAFHRPGMGFGRPERFGESRVEVGRPVQVADD